MEWEANFLLWLEQFRNPTMNSFWVGVSYVGLGLLCVPGVLSIFRKKERATTLTMVVTIATSFLLNAVIIKAIVHRARPYESWSMLHPLVYPIDASFPSGHTLFSFLLAFFYFRMFPKKIGIPSLILATLIMLSRLMIGVHYPSDVCTSLILAYISVEIGYRCVLPWIQKKMNR